MIAHGNSNAIAIKNMIVLMKEVVDVNLNEKIAGALQLSTVN
jgi:hypothetical protein